MSAILTVRLDEELKTRATKVMKRQGITPSSAVQDLFEYVVKYDSLPFKEDIKPEKSEIERKVKALDALRLSQPSGMSDEEIREGRINERYGFDA